MPQQIWKDTWREPGKKDELKEKKMHSVRLVTRSRLLTTARWPQPGSWEPGTTNSVLGFCQFLRANQPVLNNPAQRPVTILSYPSMPLQVPRDFFLKKKKILEIRHMARQLSLPMRGPCTYIYYMLVNLFSSSSQYG
jgi:hypothetical protein